MMHAVETDIDKVEVVPLLFSQQPAHHRPLLAAHVENLLLEPVFFIRAKVFHIDRILPHQFVDLRFERGGISKVVFDRVGRKKTTDADAIHLAWRIVWRHSHEDRLLAFARQLVPDSERLDGSRVCEGQLVVRMVGAIAESIDAERTRVLAGAHAHPGRDRDRRDHALQGSINPEIHQAAQVHQALIAKDDFGCGAVEAEYADFHVVRATLVTVTTRLPWCRTWPLRGSSRSWAPDR